MPLTNLFTAKKLPVPVDYMFLRSHALFLFDKIAAAVIAVDSAGFITIFNSEAEQVFNRQAKDVLGMPLKKVFPNLPSHEYYLLRILKTGKELKDVEFSYCPYTNQEGIFSHSVALVKGQHGTIDGAIWLRKDLTWEHRFQKEVNNVEIQAIVSQIAAGTAHEIRNPLTTAQGYIQMAKQHCPPEVQEYLEIAMEEMNQINRTITEFLAFIHPGEEGLQFISLNNLLEDLLQLMEKVGTMVNIEFIAHLDKDIPLCLLDSELVKQAVLNVLRNAIEAMPQGGRLSVDTSFCRDTDEVMIDIADTGAEIHAEVLDRIFKPFVSMKVNSPGQALTLANRIVQHQGGYLQVCSKKDRGTSVKIFFPVCKS
ncbi:ATP-binding protein [Dethiobacter alkaliphilus]|uniref:ATP-binding protein n=1 Tax=Dethiobacter alkaliphilus TaxID=427926 RepID=UPI002226DA26|nr:ATP-binding protein [Dethiobacter alkaliphilus]MCW3491020.1 ATP-binding protein [Dethiobacter alkaliphilus]